MSIFDHFIFRDFFQQISTLFFVWEKVGARCDDDDDEKKVGEVRARAEYKH